MKKLLIIKTGDTFPEIKAVDGDFEKMFANCLSGIDVEIEVYDPRQEATFPALQQFAGVIITGSHSMVTDCEEWSERLLPYIQEMRQNNVPTLGVCYGHQLIAKSLGGELGFPPEGPQAGSTEISLSALGKADKLLGLSPNRFKVNAGNSQRITQLPDGAVVLAGNDFEPHQAIRFGDWMWGLQFHPEFNRRVACAYIDRTADTLIEHGRKVDVIKADCVDTPESQAILINFVELTS